MRSGSHTTFTGMLRDAVEAWRKEHGWSRETVVMHIVEAHERIGGPASTGIVFDPPTRDAFERAKVNADRVFRWLDDVTKDSNHCPPNFLPSILEALPLERRMQFLNAVLAPLGLATRALPRCDEGDATVMLFKGLVATAGTASAAMADLLDGVDPGELQRAQAALGEAQRHNAAALAKVEAKLSRGED